MKEKNKRERSIRKHSHERDVLINYIISLKKKENYLIYSKQFNKCIIGSGFFEHKSMLVTCITKSKQQSQQYGKQQTNMMEHPKVPNSLHEHKLHRCKKEMSRIQAGVLDKEYMLAQFSMGIVKSFND